MANGYKKMYIALKEQYQELYEHMREIDDDNHLMSSELGYYADFVKWKNLAEEFNYFRVNAHEEYDEDSPFSTLKL